MWSLAHQASGKTHFAAVVSRQTGTVSVQNCDLVVKCYNVAPVKETSGTVAFFYQLLAPIEMQLHSVSPGYFCILNID